MGEEADRWAPGGDLWVQAEEEERWLMRMSEPVYCRWCGAEIYQRSSVTWAAVRGSGVCVKSPNGHKPDTSEDA